MCPHGPQAFVGKFKVWPWNQEATNNGLLNILSLPVELIDKVASNLQGSDIVNLRLVNKQLNSSSRFQFLKSVAERRIVYPRYASLQNFLSLISTNDDLPHLVTEITLVGETLRVHEFGYEWAWENLQEAEDLDRFSEADMAIINEINHRHYENSLRTEKFLANGHYRGMLKVLLQRLPALRRIIINKLRTGGHIPGWEGPELLKGLSFYRRGLPTNEIFYGGWLYDLRYRRATVKTDEFGDNFPRDGFTPGPQTNFITDVAYAAKPLIRSDELEGVNNSGPGDATRTAHGGGSNTGRRGWTVRLYHCSKVCWIDSGCGMEL